MLSRIASLMVAIVVFTCASQQCEAQYTTGASRGTPAGSPQTTPFTYTVSGGNETDLLRVRIQKIASYGMGGYTFDGTFATVLISLDKKYITMGATQYYTGAAKTDSFLETGSGSYYVEFQNTVNGVVTIGTTVIIP